MKKPRKMQQMPQMAGLGDGRYWTRSLLVFQEYVRYVWISPRITITSIVDADDKVVCLYSSGGQSRDLHGLLGHTTTQQLPRYGGGRFK